MICAQPTVFLAPTGQALNLLFELQSRPTPKTLALALFASASQNIGPGVLLFNATS